MEDEKELEKAEICDIEKEISETELQQVSEDLYFSEPIILDEDELGKTEFDKGVISVSKLCGAYSAMISSGISVENAMILLTNMQTIESNERITDMNNKTQIIVAEKQVLTMENSRL